MITRFVIHVFVQCDLNPHTRHKKLSHKTLLKFLKTQLYHE